MPGNKHLHGVSTKEQREYEHIKESATVWRYGDRANEVAARTVLKKHKAEGHSRGHCVWRAPRLSRGLDIGRQDMSFPVNPEATGVKGR